MNSSRELNMQLQIRHSKHDEEYGNLNDCIPA